MALINETIKYERLNDMSIDVLQPEKNEGHDDYQIMSMSFPFISTITPEEALDLANWLIDKATYVRAKYDKKGKPKS